MSRSDAEALMRQGIELYDLGRHQEAVVCLTGHSRSFPACQKPIISKALHCMISADEEVIESYDNAVPLILLTLMLGITKPPH